jgi:hypothetical protein
VSGHLIGCVKRLDQLPTSHKLALVAFADSADDRTHIGFPGYEGVQEWACCSRGRAAELIRDLVEWGFLRQHKRGHRGQRAEYVVFPGGCCDLHRAPVEEAVVDVEAVALAAGVTVEAARLMLSALGQTLPPSSTPKASDTPDASRGNGSDAPDANNRAGDDPVDNGPLEDGKGPERVHGSRSNADAFTPTNNPPTPTSGGVEVDGASCPRHPTGHPNCRGCGTTTRQRAAAAARAKAAKKRAQDAQKVAADRRARLEAAPPPSALLDGVRAQIDATRTQRKA